MIRLRRAWRGAGLLQDGAARQVDMFKVQVVPQATRRPPRAQMELNRQTLTDARDGSPCSDFIRYRRKVETHVCTAAHTRNRSASSDVRR